MQNDKNKNLLEESAQPISSGATDSTDAPSTQPAKRQKSLLPKEDTSKGKATGGSREKGKEKAVVAEDSEYEITRRDMGFVYCSDQTFSDLSPKNLRVCWRKSMGQLVLDKDLKKLGSIPAKTRVNELLSLQAEVQHLFLYIWQGFAYFS